MKKLLIFTIMSCLIGCAPKYKSVEQYAEDMKAVQQKHKSYTLELEHLTSVADTYYRVYKKNNLWKSELSANHGRAFLFTVLFDGKDVVAYGNSGQSATILDPQTARTNGGDASENLFNWNEPKGEGIPQFVNNKEQKNGFDCRLIKYGDSYEVCVNDTLGIAVYVKRKITENSEIIINLIKADTAELPDSIFVLPDNKQKIAAEQMLEKFSKQAQNTKKQE
ncbi:MAG: hypothetical protein J5601_07350 [Elusimicrobiaceae bacterium]|nr:hypothetical protein [Elusimicrobiaceae bacterium]